MRCDACGCQIHDDDYRPRLEVVDGKELLVCSGCFSERPLNEKK
jgi:hypothetical protein